VSDAEPGNSNDNPSYILIQYSLETVNQVAQFHADPGKEFVIANVTIENHAYPLFEVRPWDFVLDTGTAIYDYYLRDKAYFSSSDIPTIEDVTLKDGGKITGGTFFQVPAGSNLSEMSIAYPLNGFAIGFKSCPARSVS